jgi:hypothetical protein
MTRPYRPMATPHERSVPTVVRMGAINVLVTRDLAGVARVGFQSAALLDG